MNKVLTLGGSIAIALAMTACTSTAEAADVYGSYLDNGSTEIGVEGIQFSDKVSGEAYLYQTKASDSAEATVYYQATDALSLDVGGTNDFDSGDTTYTLGSEYTLMKMSDTSPVFVSLEAEAHLDAAHDTYALVGANVDYTLTPTIKLTSEFNKTIDVSTKDTSKVDMEIGAEYQVLPTVLVDVEYGTQSDQDGYAEVKVTVDVDQAYVKPTFKQNFESDDSTYGVEVGYNF